MTPVDVLGVRIEFPANVPLVLLQEREGDKRLLPIMIGSAEASAIHYALEGVVPPRPLTHDLFVTVLTTLGARVDRVVVTEFRDHTYFAQLHLAAGDQTHKVSSRPSDAIALAVRVGAPVFVDDGLLDEVGQVPPAVPDGEADEIIDEFNEFLKSVNPDDFAS